MSNKTSKSRMLMAALIGLAAMTPAQAGKHAQGEVLVAAADCYAVGQRVAAENGGTLARAQASEQGGQPVCVVVVLVPGKDGERPRRAEIVVPAN